MSGESCELHEANIHSEVLKEFLKYIGFTDRSIKGLRVARATRTLAAHRSRLKGLRVARATRNIYKHHALLSRRFRVALDGFGIILEHCITLETSSTI